MTTHVDTILAGFQTASMGFDRAASTLSAADQSLGKSIDAARRAGFTAVGAHLQTALQDLRQLQTALTAAKRLLGEAHSSIVGSPKELSSEQVLGILSPIGGKLGQVEAGVLQIRSALPGLAQRIAVAANQSPAIGMLNTLAQQGTAQILDRITAVKQALDAATTDAQRARSGGA